MKTILLFWAPAPGLPAALQAGQLGQHFAPAPSGATYGLAPSGATVGSPGLPAAGREFRALALPGTAQTGRSGELHLQHRLIDTTVKIELLIRDSEEIKLDRQKFS